MCGRCRSGWLWLSIVLLNGYEDRSIIDEWGRLIRGSWLRRIRMIFNKEGAWNRWYGPRIVKGRHMAIDVYAARLFRVVCFTSLWHVFTPCWYVFSLVHHRLTCSAWKHQIFAQRLSLRSGWNTPWIYLNDPTQARSPRKFGLEHGHQWWSVQIHFFLPL